VRSLSARLPNRAVPMTVALPGEYPVSNPGVLHGRFAEGKRAGFVS